MSLFIFGLKHANNWNHNVVPIKCAGRREGAEVEIYFSN